MMQYLTWRVMAGLNRKIEISFMMVGHTKFAPDWAFGLLKQKFRRSNVGCLHDLAKMVRDSSTINNAQSEDGTVFVRQYNWSSFFEKMFKRQAFDGIKSLHHLVFTASTPGKLWSGRGLMVWIKPFMSCQRLMKTGNQIQTPCPWK
jgi:hypothetical protein